MAPRGELSAGSLGVNYQKKRLFIFLAKIVRLYDNITWQASNASEAIDFQEIFGVTSSSIDIALDLPSKSVPYNNGLAEPSLNDCLRVIFLSRLSREKNLHYALEILNDVRGNVLFDIYGPLEDKVYWAKCEKIIGKLPDNVKVNYCGPVNPDEVLSVFSRYSLFFFPTSGESYGHVIAESLTAGTQVLVSDQTPWKNLADEGLGWDVPLKDTAAFTEIINRLSAGNLVDCAQKRDSINKKVVKKLLDPVVLEANRALFKKQINT
jgi:glycosyltransferase involved in cell wall biosynthesis